MGGSCCALPPGGAAGACLWRHTPSKERNPSSSRVPSTPSSGKASSGAGCGGGTFAGCRGWAYHPTHSCGSANFKPLSMGLYVALWALKRLNEIVSVGVGWCLPGGGDQETHAWREDQARMQRQMAACRPRRQPQNEPHSADALLSDLSLQADRDTVRVKLRHHLLMTDAPRSFVSLGRQNVPRTRFPTWNNATLARNEGSFQTLRSCFHFPWTRNIFAQGLSYS